jgi:hypothetical protein
MRLSTLAGACVALFAVAAAAAGAQSLGDVAKREEARRKGVKAPSKTYTNDSLGPVEPVSAAASPAAAPQADASSGSGAPAPAAAAAGQAVTPAPDAPRDEKYWRGKLEAARSALSRAQMFQEALQSRINALSTDFVNRDDPAQRSVIAADRQKAMAELDRVKQENAELQKAIAAIQEEGRRAGAPAGWLR